MRESPLISVIIPTYNRPTMLREAIASVLNQTYQHIEIVVINDGGDDVQSVIDSFNCNDQIIYLPLAEHCERSMARNKGIRASHGEYIAYLDDDDIYYPEHLSTLIRTVIDRDVSVVYSDAYEATQLIHDDSYTITDRKVVYSVDFNRNYLLIENIFPNLVILHKRECFEQVGGFDESLFTHEDWELWIRMSLHYDFCHIPTITAEYRVRENGANTISQFKGNALESRIAIYKKYRYLIESNPQMIQLQENIVARNRATM